MALERILETTRAELDRRRRDIPVAGLLRRVRPADRSLARALARSRAGFIMECKCASPSEGVIRADYRPAEIARVYAEHADAISVLTDGPWFRGSLDHVQQVRAAVEQPVLRKDFILDPYQVIEARAHGADAVLLMLSVLDDAGWRDCSAAAGEVGLETLTEVHTDEELDRALALGAGIIGINNRDLTTLQVTLAPVRRLAPRVPTDRLVVCESGIRDHADVRSLTHLVDGFLVGTSLMRQADLAGAVRRLVFGETKVCGLTREADARAAWRAGATHGGLIFAAESPRRITPEQARNLTDAAPLRWVGVFVNQSPEIVAGIARTLRLSAVQLHGEETPDDVMAVRRALPEGCEVWKAVRVRDRIPRVAETGADRIVLDTWRSDRRGGTGERFDWSLLHSWPDRDRALLSGGLTPQLAAAAATTGTWGLDVNSGVEDRPGHKSAERLLAFFDALRGTGRKRESA
jgi:indole-3-glycerol phosphate synthase/phosphoribosylanthranilate isomerase